MMIELKRQKYLFGLHNLDSKKSQKLLSFFDKIKCGNCLCGFRDLSINYLIYNFSQHYLTYLNISSPPVDLKYLSTFKTVFGSKFNFFTRYLMMSIDV